LAYGCEWVREYLAESPVPDLGDRPKVCETHQTALRLYDRLGYQRHARWLSCELYKALKRSIKKKPETPKQGRL
jgi:hypothetical protein